MTKQNRHIDWTDVLFIPSALVLSYVLASWIPQALATAISFALVVLAFALFKPRKGSLRQFLIPLLLATIMVYALVVLFRWSP